VQFAMELAVQVPQIIGTPPVSNEVDASIEGEPGLYSQPMRFFASCGGALLPP
jgi:hypothetical protein